MNHRLDLHFSNQKNNYFWFCFLFLFFNHLKHIHLRIILENWEKSLECVIEHEWNSEGILIIAKKKKKKHKWKKYGITKKTSSPLENKILKKTLKKKQTWNEHQLNPIDVSGEQTVVVTLIVPSPKPNSKSWSTSEFLFFFAKDSESSLLDLLDLIESKSCITVAWFCFLVDSLNNWEDGNISIEFSRNRNASNVDIRTKIKQIQTTSFEPMLEFFGPFEIWNDWNFRWKSFSFSWNEVILSYIYIRK